MPTYLEIAVNVPQVSGVFHYHLPPELEGLVHPGHLVAVPFGKQHVQGVVLRQVESPAVSETRAVLALIDSEVALTSAQLALAEHLAETTLAPLSTCIDLMLPAGLSQMADVRYQIETSRLAASSQDNINAIQTRLVDTLKKRGALTGRQIDRAFPRLNWRAAIRPLLRNGLISSQPVLPPPGTHPISVRTAQLIRPIKTIESQPEQLGKTGSPAFERRLAILRLLDREAQPVEVSWIYAESKGNLTDLHYLAERGWISLGEAPIWRDPLQRISFIPHQPPELTSDQASAWAAIRSGLEATAAGGSVPPFLLHGVTGSGKTEIYLHAVAEVILRKQQAIVLVPEIALTPQTVQRFLARFPGQVGLIHSGLSAGERYDTWRRAHEGTLSVIIGPRSALFTPLPELGLIVVDEFHDDSYYQGETLPYYHAREAAIAYARLSGALCVLGSATPDLPSRYQAEQGRWRYLHLPARILAHQQAIREQMAHLALDGNRSRYHPLENQAETADLPPVRLIDMRQELRSGNRSIFSRSLHDSLQRVLYHGQQAILFLNRRGAATYVFCRDCGHSLRCPRCDTPLVYHNPPRLKNSTPLELQPDIPDSSLRPQSTGRQEALICHHCGYRRSMPQKCPRCGSAHIRQFGTGTERVEAEVQRLFPQARTLRWDYDTTRKKGAHELILSHFIAHRADVLIGTQMLAKGLDLPLVTLVGVVLADVGLNLPDYRAAERTFQVLTQVAGRAGRSPLGGEVILQTFQPEHYAIQAAAQHDYAAFYRQELSYRRQLGYPPFVQLVRLEIRHPNSIEAEHQAREMAAKVQSWIHTEDRRATEMIGPVPCFFTRLAGQARWQILLRGPDPVSLLRNRQLDLVRVEVNPPNLL
jgi:primosomal protein N' (replication factor Y)